MKKLERLFESLLWETRLVAVVASPLSGLAMFYMATVDAWYMIVQLVDYASPALAESQRAALRSATVTHVVEIVDGYLLATVMLIFALGLSHAEYAKPSRNIDRSRTTGTVGRPVLAP